MHLSQFDYELPKDRIANAPAEPRDHSKLMVLDRKTGAIDHKHFYDLVDLFNPGDVLVRNNTKVLPAKVFGQKTTGGLVELLFVKPLRSTDVGEVWEVLSKPSLKVGVEIVFENSDLKGGCIAHDGYTRHIQFNQGHVELLISLEKIGQMPLPPYIHWEGEAEDVKEKYQTTYAKIQGSVAAPTAGLHFTKELDERLKEKGVLIEEVTLHVGLGTFLPVKTDNVLEHKMHSEWCSLSKETADRINLYKKKGQRIIAVGTTTVRTLESHADENGMLNEGATDTSIFIYPPYPFKVVNALITNFHLPKSTLLMLVGAFVSKPNTKQEFKDFQSSIIGKAYAVAIQEEYRFFSFGDAMLIQ